MLIDPTYMAMQTTGIVLVALLLRLLSDADSARFMGYWSVGWFSLALAIGMLGLSLGYPSLLPSVEIDGVRAPLLSLFCLLEYTCGFYLWAGCRHYSSGVKLQRSDLWRLIVPAFMVIAAPLAAPTVQVLLPFHSALCGYFFLMALLALLRSRPHSRLTAVGLRITQVSLAGLVWLFFWYAFAPMPNLDLYTLHFSPLYDGLVVTLLGFGLVILATDFTQHELRERNRQLAEITDQLAVAARTDSLTGLLNRRAFDAMLADRSGSPFRGGVAVVDVNDLKMLNDRHGHATGDAAIQIVARSLRTHFRITDPIFRLGGDEFLVVLEDGQSSELACRLDSVDHSLREVRVPGMAEPTDMHIAWGIADFASVEDLNPAVERADREMYRCKASRKAINVAMESGAK